MKKYKFALLTCLLLFTSSSLASAKDESKYSTNQIRMMENHYKNLVSQTVKQLMSKVPNPENKQINDEALELMANCNVASLSAWPPNIRYQMLEAYSQSSNMQQANQQLNKVLAKIDKQKLYSETDMKKFVYLGSMIVDGCNEKFKSAHWQNKFKRIGINANFAK